MVVIMAVKRREKTELTSKLHGEKFQEVFNKEFNLEPLEGNKFRGCKIPGCPGERFALGFCQPHY
jgi:hypothetical protein